LGALIRDYNEVCNKRGGFSISRYKEEDLAVYRHMRAGFLGVYGNIAGSTTLHALHAANVVQDQGGSRCVGDDVFAAVDLSGDMKQQDILSSLQSLGEVHESKVNWWMFRDIEDEGDNDHSWVYTKRPLDRFHNRMHLEQAIYLPIFGLILPLADGIHGNPLGVQDRVKILAQQTYSVIRQVQQLFPVPEPAQQNVLRKFLEAMYMSLGCPREGRLPFESFTIGGENVSGLLLPSLEYGFLESDPWSLLENRFVNRSSVLVKIPRSLSDPVFRLSEVLRDKGNLVETCMESRLRYLRNMEWLESDSLSEIRYMEFLEYREFYDMLFAGRLHRLYSVRLLDSCPRWISELLS
jgi:hypothetical protein